MKCTRNIFFIIMMVMFIIILLLINSEKNRLKLLENKNITNVINMGNIKDVYLLSQEKKVYKWSGDNLTEINELYGANKIVGTGNEVLYMNDKNEVLVYEIDNYCTPKKKFDNVLNIYAGTDCYVLLTDENEFYISNPNTKNKSFKKKYIKTDFKIKDIICGVNNIVFLDYEGSIWLYGYYDELEKMTYGPEILFRKLKDINNAETLIGETCNVVYWKDTDSNIYAHSIYNVFGDAIYGQASGLLEYHSVKQRECNDINVTDFYVGIYNVVIKDDKNNLYFKGNTGKTLGAPCYYIEHDYKKIYSGYREYNFCVTYNGVLILKKDSNKVYLIKYKDI